MGRRWSSRCANCRWLSPRRRRDMTARSKKLLKSLSGDQTVSVIRAFTYFSPPGQPGRDRHHHPAAAPCMNARAIMQKAASRWPCRACAGPALRPSDISQTLARPTSRRAHRPPPRFSARHSGRRARHRPLLAERSDIRCAAALQRHALTPRELATPAKCLAACPRGPAVANCALLRFCKLTVADEIENAVVLHEATFLRRFRRSTPTWKPRLGQYPCNFLRMGQWIGGDRGSNPLRHCANAAVRAEPTV